MTHSTTLAPAPTVIANGRKAPQSTEYAVESRQAEYQRYCDVQLAALRYEPFDETESWAWQRGWLNMEHARCIPDGCEPDDFEPQRKALYARYNVPMVAAVRR